ncbi:hypothetical protein DH2020_004859 [Rehmannia glutinosa]|uniref:Cytochrome P450 protein n=1 Tax=Rehmannia glutinosa TaxID=99300 RepID=A0ABR0XQJ4_REHGL
MWKIALIPVFGILVLWAWQFFNWVWVKPRKTEKLFRKQGMKGSSYKFLFGDTKEAELMYKEAYSKPIDIHDDIAPRIMPNILHAIKTYGNYSFIWSGPRPRVFVMDPDVIREVLTKYHTYHKSFKTSNEIAKMLATGLVIKEGEEWAKARMKLNPAFHLEKLKPMVPAIQGCSQNTLNEWKEMASKGGGSCCFDVYPYLEVFTSSVLARLMFDSTYTEQLKQTFLQLSELAFMGKLATNPLTLPGEKYFPTKKNRRAKEIDKYVRASFTSMINQRLEKRKAGAEHANQDLLYLFMQELYDGENLNDGDRQRIIDDIIGQCKIFFYAGYETNSNLLTWTMVMLSAHQDWQARAREEAVQVLRNKNEITYEDLGKLKIEHWGKDAGEFNPERFAQGIMKATKGENAYMPFGWGPRICIAQNFALLESKTFLAMLLLNFSFQLSPTYVHAPFVDFTLHPQFGARSNSAKETLARVTLLLDVDHSKHVRGC